MMTSKMVAVSRTRDAMNKRKIVLLKKSNPLIKTSMMKTLRLKKSSLITLTQKKVRRLVKLTATKFDREENVAAVAEMVEVDEEVIVIETITKKVANNIGINNTGNQLLKVLKVAIVKSLT